jgi:hypothetical protein
VVAGITLAKAAIAAERGRQNGRLLQGKGSIDFSEEIDRLGFGRGGDPRSNMPHSLMPPITTIPLARLSSPCAVCNMIESRRHDQPEKRRRVRAPATTLTCCRDGSL